MKKIIAYLILIGAVDVAACVSVKLSLAPGWVTALGLVFQCSVLGGIGGVVYCLRGVYISACVKK
jgi:hypothetical protein